ncbi:Gfo/Idh/MocA family oxidoreductase [Sinomonas notoginsengisoli]|uniref:Gfo/Idh/MocA family protein n=1 Tax=Sinomonas notoginsengisoli TaxID=1457311 RepID=UPI001F3E20B5|nr:Gfo/Idh/MocA family oxidoreductase [Sinomonas notoginsengisoli]
MTLGIGIIGLGVMGADHAETLASCISGAHIAAVTDLDSERRAGAAERHRARGQATADDLIADPTVDAVIIASHDSAHAAQVEQCIRQGKPVLCEKPLAPSAEECLRLRDMEADLGLERPLVSVGFMRRFHEPYRQLRETLRSGDLGRLVLLHEVHRNVRAYPGTSASSIVTNSAIHEIDITAWLLDSPIVEASWHAPRLPDSPSDWHAPQLIHLRTAAGTLASVEVSVDYRAGYYVHCEVVGENGSARMAQPPAAHLTSNLKESTRLAPDWRPVFADAYRRELQEWTDSIAADRSTTLASADDALDAALVAEAVLASMNNEGVPTPVRRPELANTRATKGTNSDVK